MLDEACSARRSRRTGDQNQILRRIYNRRALEAAVTDGVLEPAEGPSSTASPIRGSAEPGTRAARRSCWRVRRGTLLDVDHGTYPYVTSSNLTAGGASVRSGIGPPHHDRPGIHQGLHHPWARGPFPTELFDEHGEYLGQDRRRGWRDHRARPALRLVRRRRRSRDACQRDHRLLHQADVLSGLDEVPICVATRSMGSASTDADDAAASPGRPVCDDARMVEDISTARTQRRAAARTRYVLRLEEFVRRLHPCIGVGTRPRRNVVRRDVA